MVDIQMLLNKFEKCFYFPPLFIPFSNRITIFIQYVCNEAYLLVAFINTAFYNSVLMVTFPSLLVNQKACFIADNSHCTLNRLCSNFIRLFNLTASAKFRPAYK